MTFDLNKPEDARAYVLSWVDQDDLRCETKEASLNIQDGSDEEFMRVALQLFLYCDTRPALGTVH